MIKVRDKWFRLLIILLPFMLVICTNEIGLHPDRHRILRVLVSLASTIVICEGSRFLIYNSRRWKAPWNRPPRRIITVIASGLLLSTLTLMLSAATRNYIGSNNWVFTFKIGTILRVNNQDISMSLLVYSFLNAVTNFLFLLAAYETLYRYAQLRHTEKEKELLEKEKLRAELNQLKGIVNPHFLFNNLNSLSSLINEDPVLAEAFLDELTKVFRYLLRNNQSELTTLSQELLFIQSYYHLLQTRYGTGISMVVSVEKQYEDWQLPPLTLQLLVENAVKHNRLQKEQPLYIELYSTPANKLVIRNTMCKRESVVESTGIGLHTINARYRMLNLPEVNIEKDDHHFTVTIPLIEPKTDGHFPVGPGSLAEPAAS